MAQLEIKWYIGKVFCVCDSFARSQMRYQIFTIFVFWNGMRWMATQIA